MDLLVKYYRFFSIANARTIASSSCKLSLAKPLLSKDWSSSWNDEKCNAHLDSNEQHQDFSIFFNWKSGIHKIVASFSVPYIHEKRGNEKKVINVNSGKDVKLICNIRTTGQTSKPVYYWLKDNQVLILSDHHRMRLKPYRYLRITSAKKKDSGIYICGAVNNCGWNTYTMQLFVGSE